MALADPVPDDAVKFFGDEHRKMGQFKGLVRLTDINSGQPELSIKDLLQPRELFLRSAFLCLSGVH